MKALAAVCALLLSTNLAAQSTPASAASAAAPVTPTLLPGLAAHHHPIATASPEAQRFFDQGMALLYGFNHEEAVRSFEKAGQLDPKAAMPFWGIALALGSNINDPEPEANRLKRAFENAVKARDLSAAGPQVERDYAQAIGKRYSDDAKADRHALALAYTSAMRDLARAYPDDLDAATLFAESAMDLRPWKLWNLDGTPAEGTLEIVSTLESVLKRDPLHIGANHYYIHAVEASREPERALACADRITSLAPGEGHLVHMPAHIYERLGDFTAAARANARAAEADRVYIRATGAQGMYSIMYYGHNLHFLSAAWSMAGNWGETRKAADQLSAAATPILPEMPMVEAFLTMPTFVTARFQKWVEVLALPDPGPKYPILTTAWRYARALAWTARGDVAKAEIERKAFESARKTIPADAFYGNNTPASVFEVAAAVLDARLAAARGDREGAIAGWRRAVELQDGLFYDEPQPWYYPVRESLGAALLRAGRPQDAELVFREDLDRNPRNGRSLFGLAAALETQKKTADAQWVRREFDAAWKDADVKLTIDDL